MCEVSYTEANEKKDFENRLSKYVDEAKRIAKDVSRRNPAIDRSELESRLNERAWLALLRFDPNVSNDEHSWVMTQLWYERINFIRRYFSPKNEINRNTIPGNFEIAIAEDFDVSFTQEEMRSYVEKFGDGILLTIFDCLTQGYKYAEIADILHVNHLQGSAVRVYIHRQVEKLRKLLRKFPSL